MLIDTHAHLFSKEFHADIADVLRRAHDAGVMRIVVPGTDAVTSAAAIGLAHKFSGLYACAGFHPHDALRCTAESFKEIGKLAADLRVVAIGEIGLDYHYDFSPRDVQRRVFADHLSLAVRSGKPAVIHTRESMEDAIRIVKETVDRNPSWLPSAGGLPRRGVFHCFPGTAAEAMDLFSLGFFASFNGIVTFRNSAALESLRGVGYERILLETDAPYLTPVPFRGKRNEPHHVRTVAEFLAKSLEVPFESVAQRTTANAEALFHLEKAV